LAPKGYTIRLIFSGPRVNQFFFPLQVQSGYLDIRKCQKVEA
jgi:hypothetical protein